MEGDTSAALQSGAGDTGEKQVPGELWCARCGKRAAPAGGTVVHAETRSRTGPPDGHPADPVGEEPPLWKAAREIAADYRGAFEVDARFGVLHARWSLRALGPGITAAYYRADTGQDMRRQLDDAVAGTRWERPADGAAS